MKRYCGFCRNDMLTWIALETVPQDKVHGDTEVGVLAVSGVALRNNHASRFAIPGVTLFVLPE
ncbi:hypothetical protein BofuT4_uP132550.1 [Botrytis cinerea T4]|uniref:Uncharacterized protein n=1 Tax=Botryotinia fuckeliana (strain T4) TaxID=999810 RepID=G2YR27_BOTF4|nr:hypothetical protein BofuT4_uP132550.1 [Botrytis cinerea T4]